jgi:hypothetical protein
LSILENLKKKLIQIKHKELVFFVLIIVAIIITFFLINFKPNTQLTSTNYEKMGMKEELTYRITDAVNAISGDNQSKIIVYWDTMESKDASLSFDSLFNTDENEGVNTKVLGVAIVCKGGNEAETKVKITLMLSKVFGIDADRISVLGKK